MFGNYDVIQITLCGDHMGDETLRDLMHAAAQRVHELHPPTELGVQQG